MRSITLVFLITVMAVLLGACNENVNDLLKLQPVGPAGPLYGRSWYNSHEAPPGDTIVYRPQGYLVPASTPRYGPLFLDGLRCDKDGQFTLYTFGPADAPEAHVGRWESLAEDKNTLAITLENSKGQRPFQLRVLSVQNDKMLVARLP